MHHRTSTVAVHGVHASIVDDASFIVTGMAHLGITQIDALPSGVGSCSWDNANQVRRGESLAGQARSTAATHNVLTAL
jgi:hypothetical protein